MIKCIFYYVISLEIKESYCLSLLNIQEHTHTIKIQFMAILIALILHILVVIQIFSLKGCFPCLIT